MIYVITALKLQPTAPTQGRGFLVVFKQGPGQPGAPQHRALKLAGWTPALYPRSMAPARTDWSWGAAKATSSATRTSGAQARHWLWPPGLCL